MELKLDDIDDCVYACIILGSTVIIALYVDDLLITSPTMDTMDHLKGELPTRFCIKDVIEARMVLGFKIHCDCTKRLL